MRRSTFYICKHCGNIAMKPVDSGVPLVCCGEEMAVLEANSTDAATEKRVPAVTVTGNEVHVEVGSTQHPMEEDHYIEWVYLVTGKGVQSKCFKPGEVPAADFVLVDDRPIAVYEYCNKHGLWVARSRRSRTSCSPRPPRLDGADVFVRGGGGACCGSGRLLATSRRSAWTSVESRGLAPRVQSAHRAERALPASLNPARTPRRSALPW